jgi:mono/diheme cytochrome c family protein
VLAIMKRHCGLGIVLLITGAGLFGIIGSAPAQSNVPQIPRPIVPATVTPVGALDKFLQFDAEDKTVTVTNGTEQAHFTFSVTNISNEEVLINYIIGSCHCTVAQLPSQPWKLAPKEVGEFSATMDLAGSPPDSSKFKTLTVNADKGQKVLKVTTRILPDMSSPEERTNMMKMATADRQAVFKNADCVQCHVETAKDSSGHDKMGEELYTAVCGVCHESSHRATFVPDLHHLKDPTSAAFWRIWITSGKPGTLMPAFAKIEGGPLSNEQIDSLVNYLSASIPPEPVKLSPPSGLKVVPQ